jgi:cobalt-zinc-cadmium efflux system membrane fusion protein
MMKKLIYIIILTGVFLHSCAPKADNGQAAHDHSGVKLQLVSYNEDFELYAEADPFISDHPSSILAHFTFLEDFSPLDSATITASLIVGSKGIRQVVETSVSEGIFAFNLQPIEAGVGELIFDIRYAGGESRMLLKNIKVYTDEEVAMHMADMQIISDPNGIAFTKEQSWKVDFSTAEVLQESIGTVIKTTAQIEPAQSDMISLPARTAGVVVFSGDNIFAGTAIQAGDPLFSISGKGLANDNSYVRYAEAKSNYEKSLANYERLKLLAKDKIVSEKALLEAKSEYETDKVVYENLQSNFSGGAQIVKSPISGFVKHIYVSNGQYVEAGQKLIDISQNEKLILKADVQQKYAAALQKAVTANIRTVHDQQTYTLDECNGKLLSFGRSVNHDNFMIPVRYEIDNNFGFLPGSFVELYIITQQDDKVLTVPNNALLEDQGKYFVIVQLTPELFIKREVSIGATNGLKTEISSGLSEHERVVSDGAILVKLSQSSGALDPHAGHVH